MNRRRFVKSALSATAALTFKHGTSDKAAYAKGSGPRHAKIVMNVGSIVSNQYNNINCAKTTNPLLNKNPITILDDDGYPTGTLVDGFGMDFLIPPSWATKEFILKWQGSIEGAGGLYIAQKCNVTVLSGTLVSGGRGSPALLRGKNGRFRVTFNLPEGQGFVSSFLNPGTRLTGFTNYVVCRTTDEAAVDAGEKWNPQWVDALKADGGLNIGVLRMMGCITSSGSEPLINPDWNLRKPITALTYNPFRIYVANIWAGTITNDGNHYSCPSYPTMPSKYTEGEVWQGRTSSRAEVFSVTSAFSSGGKIGLILSSTDVALLNTGDVISYEGYTTNKGIGSYGIGLWKITKLSGAAIELTSNYWGGAASVYETYSKAPGRISNATINVGDRGVKPFVGFSSIIGATPYDKYYDGYCYFVYKELLDAVMVQSGPIFVGLNPELLVDACNKLDVNCWWNIPFHATDEFIESGGKYIRDNLNPNKTLHVELSNEPWNFGFPQYLSHWTWAIALNLPNKNSLENVYSIQGLRMAMIADQLLPIWSTTRPAVDLIPTCTVWPVASLVGTLTTGVNRYLCKGNDLETSGNARLSAYTRGVSYNKASPKFTRPIDKLRCLSVATYFGVVDLTKAGTVPYELAKEFALGEHSVALGKLDAYIRRNFATDYVDAGLLSIIESICASYDHDRPSSMPRIVMDQYEGGMQNVAPALSDYVSAGHSSSATVTFNIGSSPSVNWPGHGLRDGCRIAFSNSGGELPSNLISGANYYVVNATMNAFDIVKLFLAPVTMKLTGSPSGIATATAGQYSFDNVLKAYFNDTNLMNEIIQFYNNAILNRASYPHFNRTGFLQLEGAGVFGGNTIATTWSLYPYGMDTVPFKQYEALVKFNAQAMP
jgi:hypothetical protein